MVCPLEFVFRSAHPGSTSWRHSFTRRCTVTTLQAGWVKPSLWTKMGRARPSGKRVCGSSRCFNKAHSCSAPSGVATAPAPLLHTQQMAVELPPTRTVLSGVDDFWHRNSCCLWCNWQPTLLIGNSDLFCCHWPSQLPLQRYDEG